MKRTSLVNQIKLISLANSSVFEIGDAEHAQPVSRVIAQQKEGKTFKGDLNFEDYSIFQKAPKQPTHSPNVYKETINHSPYIHVNQTYIIAVSTASIVQVGNLNHIQADSRIKHFRIILSEEDPNNS